MATDGRARASLVVAALAGAACFGAAAQEPPDVLELSIAARPFYEHEPVHVLATLENKGTKPAKATGLGGGWAGAGILNFEIEAPGGKKVTYTAGIDRKGFVGEPRQVTLAAREKTIGEFDLTKYSDLSRPGEYRITGVYYHPSGGAIQEVRSAKLKLEIRAPEDDVHKRLVSECLSYEGKPIQQSLYDSDNEYFFDTMGFERKYLQALKSYRGARLTKYLGFYLARYYQKRGKPREAIAVLEPVVAEEVFALTDDALLLLAKCHREVGRPEDAAKALERIQKDFPAGNCAKEAKALAGG